MRFSELRICLLWLVRAQAVALPRAEAEAPTAPATGIPNDLQDSKLGDPEQSDYLDLLTTDGIAPLTQKVTVETKSVPTGTLQVLPTLLDVTPQTTGLCITEVDQSNPTPLITNVIPSVTKLLEPVSSLLEPKSSLDDDELLSKRAPANIFAAPIATGAPPSNIAKRSDHPVPRTGITKSGPMQTNKFYSNFFLGNRDGPTFTFPYSVAWTKGKGPASSWGLAISHIRKGQRVFGDKKYNNAASYYINPIGIHSMILSAKELGKDTVLNVDNANQFHARVILKKNASSKPTIYFPLVQGMPYVSGRFEGGTPLIQSGVYFKSMIRVEKDPKRDVRKYTFELTDTTVWHVYAYRTGGTPLDLQLINNGLAQSKKPFTGIIQIAKDVKSGGSTGLLDDGAGIYPTGASLTGSVSGSTGTYSIAYKRYGHPAGSMYMYALPHHVQSFDSATKKMATKAYLDTTTKGTATLVRGRTWTMLEPGMPTGMNFGPWKAGPKVKLSAAAKAAIRPIARQEVSQNMGEQTNLDSMYFSGKALLKFAQIVYVIQDQLNDKALAQAGLAKLKEAFRVFSQNKQKYPLVYESAWGGVVSSATYRTGDSGVDFGNTYYNDHHFHWGYHILTAAYIGHLDKGWVAANKAYVNTLVRDIQNPSSKDTLFPEFRNFDWFHGHSWAKGLFSSLDGKDQESSSEDIMSLYAVKMWGQVIGDGNMVARSNLQLTISRRALRNYYLYTNDNKVQPANFIGNKVAGILFENKVHHTTYFSDDIECIQGIHMIPVHAPTGFSRSDALIRQEWNAFFSNGRIDRIDNGWKSIIYANSALVAPRRAWDYFRANSFKQNWLDGGASRTWYMAYTAGVGGI